MVGCSWEKIYIEDTHHMAQLSLFFPIWPSHDVGKKHMPEEFKLLYPITHGIIDCTEIQV